MPHHHQQPQKELSLKDYFVPLTTVKIIHFIAIIGIIVFFPTIFNGFVGDDMGQVVNNKLVHSIENIPQLFGGSSFSMGGQSNGVYYKPLMSSYFAFTYSILGASPFFFHVFQLFFHIANAILLFFLLKSFFSKDISFLLALVFL